MKSNELSKEHLAKLISENPTAALEYIWETRKTLKACNKRRMELDGALRALVVAVAPIRLGQRDGGTFGNLSVVDDDALKVLEGK